MKPYEAQFAVDDRRYQSSVNDPEAYYGLPPAVHYCKSCVISNQRPNSSVEFAHTRQSVKEAIHFDEEGVCDACRVAESKRKNIDWNMRDKELRAICDKYRSGGRHYDCVVPGSGGKDSFLAAHKLKYEYGMSPLTVTWAPHIYTDWGWRNHRLWNEAGFDNILVTPNGLVHRLLTRLSLENLFHPFQPFVLGQKNLAPKLAARFGIPLVFYGENEAEYGNPISDAGSARRSWGYFATADKHNVYLGGTPIDDLQRYFDLRPVDLDPYMPADPAELERVGVEVHYLGYYMKWHPQGAYYYAVEHGGFQASPERTPGTYSKYNSIDDKVDDLHYYCTFIKYGIGRATYDAAQEIRSGEITREEGVALVNRFDGEFPVRFEEDLWGYLSITEDKFPVASKMFQQPNMTREYFLMLADKFRSPHLWVKENGTWRLRNGKVQNVS